MTEPTRTAIRRAELHPSASEEWFRALPHAHRARMNREWRAGLAQDHELVHDERRRALVSAGRMALLHGLLDLGCPGSSPSSCVLVALLGASLGVLLEKLRAARLLSGTLGLLAFVAAQWLTHGGLSAAHLFWFFPAGAISAYLGVAREE